MACNINISKHYQIDTHLNKSISDEISNSDQKDHLKTDVLLQGSVSNHDQKSNSRTSPNIYNNEIINEEEGNRKENFHFESDELQIKPAHWTDEYWQKILTKYPWFLHKNDLAGCKICHNVKVFVGKKSLLSSMKLYIMNLSYEEFENKLEIHNTSNQHSKCEEHFKQGFNVNAKKEEVVHLKTLTNILNEPKSSEYSCPQCNKGYTFKKALVNHLYICDPKYQESLHYIPCNCPIQNIHSLCSLDQHISSVHADQYHYICGICFVELSKSAELFEHLFLKHDYLWDTYNESPMVKLKDENINLSNMGEDTNKASNFKSKYSDAGNSSNSILENCRFDSENDGTLLNLKPSVKQAFVKLNDENINLSNIGEDTNKASDFTSKYSDAGNCSNSNLENCGFDSETDGTPLNLKPSVKQAFVKLKDENINLSNMGEDTNKASSVTSRYSDAGDSSKSNLENCRLHSENDGTPLNIKPGVKRAFKEISQTKTSSFKKPKFEMTNCTSSNSIPIDLNMIVICPVCEGRYLSEKVLKSHMERYHSQ